MRSLLSLRRTSRAGAGSTPEIGIGPLFQAHTTLFGNSGKAIRRRAFIKRFFGNSQGNWDNAQFESDCGCFVLPAHFPISDPLRGEFCELLFFLLECPRCAVESISQA